MDDIDNSPVYLKEEKQYVETIRLYMILISTLLSIYYLTWIIITSTTLFTGHFFGKTELLKIVSLSRLISCALTDTLLKLHFVFFIRTNFEFKLTLLQPWRDFRKVFCKWCEPRPYRNMYYEPVVFVTELTSASATVN